MTQKAEGNTEDVGTKTGPCAGMEALLEAASEMRRLILHLRSFPLSGLTTDRRSRCRTADRHLEEVSQQLLKMEQLARQLTGRMPAGKY